MSHPFNDMAGFIHKLSLLHDKLNVLLDAVKGNCGNVNNNNAAFVLFKSNYLYSTGIYKALNHVRSYLVVLHIAHIEQV